MYKDQGHALTKPRVLMRTELQGERVYQCPIYLTRIPFEPRPFLRNDIDTRPAVSSGYFLSDTTALPSLSDVPQLHPRFQPRKREIRGIPYRARRRKDTNRARTTVRHVIGGRCSLDDSRPSSSAAGEDAIMGSAILVCPRAPHPYYPRARSPRLLPLTPARLAPHSPLPNPPLLSLPPSSLPCPSPSRFPSYTPARLASHPTPAFRFLLPSSRLPPLPIFYPHRLSPLPAPHPTTPAFCSLSSSSSPPPPESRFSSSLPPPSAPPHFFLLPPTVLRPVA
ncbi:hypothetical protein DFH07DRAFT_973158 [Mycena maculata]|uniref:Uncharacterized protein n=1 Tax=Mycena maculata TaxID=230809 RepID=A0AAD7HEI7_9AGAR|nr:hypothetical protein DFH07DRAFT_973158 [Mycena maculata]